MAKRGAYAKAAQRAWLNGLIAEATPHSCIDFLGRLNEHGYGIVRLDGRQMLAHRAIIQLLDCLPAGSVVRHTCDRPSCINPYHLLIGTQAENVADMHRRGRYVKVAVGPRNPKAKLRPEQVQEIRQSFKRRAELAQAYGVSLSTIGRIQNGKLWAMNHA